jgi:hypothetical protein
MAILPHALAALMLGYLRFSSFLQGAHKVMISMPVWRSAMQASVETIRNRLLIFPCLLPFQSLSQEEDMLAWFDLSENR